MQPLSNMLKATPCSHSHHASIMVASFAWANTVTFSSENIGFEKQCFANATRGIKTGKYNSSGSHNVRRSVYHLHSHNDKQPMKIV